MHTGWKTAFALMGLGVWGCGPPEIVPVVMPGSKPLVVIPESEQAEALGEQQARGTVQPPTQGGASSIPLAEPTKLGETQTTSDNLKYETIREGTGAQAKPGQRATVHYIATLTNGALVESSRSANQPRPFVIGAREVIRGWDLGVAGMRVGEIRRLTIPAELAYGDEGKAPAVPPKSTLVFEIELLGVEE